MGAEVGGGGGWERRELLPRRPGAIPKFPDPCSWKVAGVADVVTCGLGDRFPHGGGNLIGRRCGFIEPSGSCSRKLDGAADGTVDGPLRAAGKGVRRGARFADPACAPLEPRSRPSASLVAVPRPTFPGSMLLLESNLGEGRF